AASPSPGTPRKALRNSGRHCRSSSAVRLRANYRSRACLYSVRSRASGNPAGKAAAPEIAAPSSPLPRGRTVRVANSVATMLGGPLAGDAAEHGADGHADAGKIALAEHVAGHDLAGREHVAGALAVLHQHARLFIHARAEIGEGDAGTQRIAVIRRRIELARPMRFRDGKARGRAVVEHGVVERAGAHRGVELLDRPGQRR